MVGFVTAVNRITGDLNRGSDFASRVKEAIEAAIIFYQAKRLPWNQSRRGFTAATEYRSLSESYVLIDTLTVDLGSQRRALISKPHEWITERKVDPNFTSEPVYYAQFARQLRFYPAPDQTYSFEATIIESQTEISVSATDSASNIWTTEGLELIRVHVMIEMLEMYIGGAEAYAQADRLRLREAQEYRQLRSHANIEAASGRIQSWI